MESYQFSKDQEDEIKVSVFAFWRKAEKKTENCFDSQKVSASPSSVPSLFQMSNSHFSLKGAGSFHSAGQSKEGQVGFGTSQHPILMKLSQDHLWH